MAKNPRTEAAKELLTTDEDIDFKEEKEEKKKEKEPESEEMGEVTMRVILPDSPELATLDVGGEILLRAIKVAESNGRVSLDVVKIEEAAVEEGIGELPKPSDITAALTQATGGQGSPAGAGALPLPPIA